MIKLEEKSTRLFSKNLLHLSTSPSTLLCTGIPNSRDSVIQPSYLFEFGVPSLEKPKAAVTLAQKVIYILISRHVRSIHMNEANVLNMLEASSQIISSSRLKKALCLLYDA